MECYIVYDGFAIKTKNGYTIFQLGGLNDAEVYERDCFGKERTRFARGWSFWAPTNHVDVMDSPADDVLAATRKMTDKRGYHWSYRTSGNLVDDAGLLRWVKNCIKNAVTFEGLLRANDLPYLELSLIENISPNPANHWLCSRKCLERRVYTEKEFSQWVKDAKAILATAADMYTAVYGLPVDGFNHPYKAAIVSPNDKFLIKAGNNYLTGYELDYGDDGKPYLAACSWGPSEFVKSGRRDPEQFSFVEAEKLQGLYAAFMRGMKISDRRGVKIVSAKTLDAAKALDARRVYVVQYPDGWYATKKAACPCDGTMYINKARHFTEKEAETFVENAPKVYGLLSIKLDTARESAGTNA